MSSESSATPVTMEAIEKLFVANNAVLQSIKDDVHESRNDIKAVQNSISGVQVRVNKLEAQNDERDEIIRKQNSKINDLEVEIRKRNVVLYKLLENESNAAELEQNVLQLLSEISGTNFANDHLEAVFRMGKKQENTDRIRPVLISFASIKNKNLVMQKTKLFVESGYGLSEDFPKEVSERRRVLLPIVKVLKSENLKAVLRKDKLVVDGVEWSPERIADEMEKRQTQAKSEDLAHNAEYHTDTELPTNSNEVVPVLQLANTGESSKRIRTSDEEPTPEKTPKLPRNNELKTTIIGSCTNKNPVSTKNPIKEAMRRKIISESAKK